MIRKATKSDIESVCATYAELFAYEKIHGSTCHWVEGVYPTPAVASNAFEQGSLFVLENNGAICASMILNQNQAPEYANINWEIDAPPDKVLVIHTLCVPPSCSGRGYATQMLKFAIDFGRRLGCCVIRMDTYSGNEPAKQLYLNNGFKLSGKSEMMLNGVLKEELVCLERKI